MIICKMEKIQLNSAEADRWIDMREILARIINGVEDSEICDLAEKALDCLNELWNDHVIDDFE